MKKKLSNTLCLYYTNTFPYKSTRISSKKNKVTLGIGGNIGDVKKTFKLLFLLLLKDRRFHIEATTPMLQNPPFGYLEQNDFINAIIVVSTNLSAFALLKVTQRYENRFKRKRTFQDAPRTLDIDIIFFNQEKINTQKLTIPHKGYTKRDSVQIPLSYLKQNSFKISQKKYSLKQIIL